jgi:hypothetical protein
VIQLALSYRWEVFHPPANLPFKDARGRVVVQKMSAGWPDLSFARTPELFFAELKSEAGSLSPAQRRWIELLRSCGQEVYVWRPSDFDAIHERLRR